MVAVCVSLGRLFRSVSGGCSAPFRGVVGRVVCGVVLAVLVAAGAAAQGSAEVLNFRDSGPLFWLPKAHANWPRLASMWLPNDACSTTTVDRAGDTYRDPYRTVVLDVHNQSCPSPWSWKLWEHRETRSLAEREFALGSSFDHDDLDVHASERFRPWHWQVSGMPESQRCYPAPPEVSYGNHRQAGWGGLQVSQHLGEWYQGRQYLPDYQAGRVRANAAAGALPASGFAAYVTKYGYFDFDIYSRPAGANPAAFSETGESCVASAVYNLYRTGAGGRESTEARACAAESLPLLMRTNTEMRCEPDLSLYTTAEHGDHPYADDFRVIMDDEYREASVVPTQPANWWPPPAPGPEDYFGYAATVDYRGSTYVIRSVLGEAGVSYPFEPKFPHNWDAECDEEDAVLGCGPGSTERDRRFGRRADEHPRKDDTRLVFGSRPLFRRMEVSISMPGETVDDTGTRSYPDAWDAGFTGYLSATPGVTPNAIRETRAEVSTRERDAAAYGSAAWFADRLSYGDDGARSLGFEGVRVDDPLTAAEDLTDCLRFLPSDRPVADRQAAAGAEVSEFWNNPAWRECAGTAFSGERGGTSRLSSGTTGVNTWLRHQGDDADIQRELEFAETNLDTDGWIVDADGNRIGSNAGLPEVPRRNQQTLNAALGITDSDHEWYRTSGAEIACLWGGYVRTDLAGAAYSMHDKALEKTIDGVLTLIKVNAAIGQANAALDAAAAAALQQGGGGGGGGGSDGGDGDGGGGDGGGGDDSGGSEYRCSVETDWSVWSFWRVADRNLSCTVYETDGTTSPGTIAERRRRRRSRCDCSQGTCGERLQHESDYDECVRDGSSSFSPWDDDSPFASPVQLGQQASVPGGRPDRLGAAAARVGAPGSSGAPVSRAAAPGRGSQSDAVEAARFAGRGTGAGSLVGAGDALGGLLAPSSASAAVVDARQRAGEAAQQPVSALDLRSGARALRDGLLLADVQAANRFAPAAGDSAGGGFAGGGASDRGFQPLERSSAPASLPPAAAGGSAVAAAASSDVWDAASAGNDAAAGAWYGYNVGGERCLSGTACASAIASGLNAAAAGIGVRAFGIGLSWVDVSWMPPACLVGSSVNFMGPGCLLALLAMRAAAIAQINTWAPTMMGWHAVGVYREEIASAVDGAISPYMDWRASLSPLTPGADAGVLQNVPTVNYIESGDPLGALNPVCVTPPRANPVPLHAIVRTEETIDYFADNEQRSSFIFDDTGAVRRDATVDSEFEWPPPEAVRHVAVPGRSAGDEGVRSCDDVAGADRPAICDDPDGAATHFRSMVPGRYTGGENDIWREVFFGDDPADAGYDVESFGRFGMSTMQYEDLEPEVRARLPRTLRSVDDGGDDHLQDVSETVSPVVFREFSCPAIDQDGNYGASRPVVCQDGSVWWGWFLPDHRTPCSLGQDGCEERIFSEPVLATGGRGYDALRSTPSAGTPGGEPLVELFGDSYRHVCDFSSAVPTVSDGRVAAHAEVTRHSFLAHVYSLSGGVWVSGSGAGDGLAHGHDPDEGYYPRAGWYTDQGGVERWYEPFSAYDNYAELETAGDLGAGDELLARDAGLFPEHVEESRILDAKGEEGYDEYVSTPYEVRQRNADFQLWSGNRTEDAPNRDESMLMWGWPSLDIQDASNLTRFATMRVRRLQTQQQLFGVPPGQERAEQVWVRNDGPMSFFGATRVANGAIDPSTKGGCLLEVNPPDVGLTRGTSFAARPVLDQRQQAWCVMAHDVGPKDSCVSVPDR